MTFQPISDELIHSLERKLAREHASDLSLDLPSRLPPSFSFNTPPASTSIRFPDTPFPSGTPTTSATLQSTSSSGHFLSDVPSQPLTWLWPTRIPLGHLTLLDADPSCDPSLFALTLAASLSSGSPLPDGTFPPSPSTVLLYAPYDSAASTLKPRLQAAGGDPAHLFLFRPSTPSVQHPSPTSTPHIPSFTLPRDLSQLAATIRRLDARLVILDPASAIPGLARCLPALADLAQQTNCAILLLRSLRHPITDPLHASGPASPLLDAVRSRLLLIPDPQDDTHTLLLTTRHLLSPQSAIPILAYDTHLSPDGLPILHYLGNYDRSLLARLSTGPVHSVHRQAILHFLHDSPTPQPISAILTATCYDHEAGRKMLLRMKQAGELLSPARGLYTTPNHPSLSTLPTSTSPVPIVPTVSTVQTINLEVLHKAIEAVPTVPTVSTVQTFPSSPVPTAPPASSVPTFQTLSSPIVPPVPAISDFPLSAEKNIAKPV